MTVLAIFEYRFAENSAKFYTINASVSWRRSAESEVKPITVALNKGKETKGTYRFDTLDPNAAITSLYVRKSTFEGSTVPKRIVLTVTEAEA